MHALQKQTLQQCLSSVEQKELVLPGLLFDSKVRSTQRVCCFAVLLAWQAEFVGVSRAVAAGAIGPIGKDQRPH